MTDGSLTHSEPRDENEIRVECLVYSRVVGFLTPVQNWNTGKQQEYEDRVVFKQPKAEG